MKYFKVPNQVFDLKLTPIEFCVLCCLLKGADASALFMSVIETAK